MAGSRSVAALCGVSGVALLAFSGGAHADDWFKDVKFSGYVEVGGMGNSAQPDSNINFGHLFTDRDNELKGRQLGADDYVTKPIDFDVLDAIIQTRLARAPRPEAWPSKAELTDREIEALTWAARGKTSAEIAQIIGLSKRTVDFHIDNARVKLGATTRLEAAIKAASGRLIEP